MDTFIGSMCGMVRLWPTTTWHGTNGWKEYKIYNMNVHNVIYTIYTHDIYILCMCTNPQMRLILCCHRRRQGGPGGTTSTILPHRDMTTL